MKDISPYISGTSEGITAVQEALRNFDKDHFIYAFRMGIWKEEKVEALTIHLQSKRPKFEKEFKKLQEFAETFVKTYALNNNACYSLTMEGLKKMKSFFASIMHIFRTFIPKTRERHRNFHLILKPKSLYSCSGICSNIYMKDLFQFYGYPQCVVDLYNEIEKLFILFIRSLQICSLVAKAVNETRNNNKICDDYLEQQENDILESISGIISVFSADKLDEEISRHPKLREFLNCQDNANRASMFYHVLTYVELQLFVILKKLNLESKYNITEEEFSLFGNDVEKILQCRYIIGHFDELLPPGRYKPGKKLYAKTVKMFLYWAKIKSGKEKYAVRYFFRKYKESSFNTHQEVGYEAINGQGNNVLQDKYEYNKFEERLKNLLLRRNSEQKNSIA